MNKMTKNLVEELSVQFLRGMKINLDAEELHTGGKPSSSSTSSAVVPVSAMLFQREGVIISPTLHSDSTKSWNEVSGSRNEISGSGNTVTGSRNEVKGQRNVVNGARNRVIGSENRVVGSRNTIIGSGNNITGSGLIIEGSGKIINMDYSNGPRIRQLEGNF